MDILNFLKEKIQIAVNPRTVDEITTLVLNGLGTAPAYMNDKQWRIFLK